MFDPGQEIGEIEIYSLFGEEQPRTTHVMEG